MRVSFVVVVLSVLYGLRGEEDCNRFKHGQSWKEDCQTCTCFDGELLHTESNLMTTWQLIILKKIGFSLV